MRYPEFGADPAVTLTVARAVDAEGMAESLTVRSAADEAVASEVWLIAIPDAGPMGQIRQGRPTRGPSVEGLS